MQTIKFVQLSSLEKVFLDDKCDGKEFETITALKNERVSYQIAYTSDDRMKYDMKVSVKSPLKEYITIRKVGNVPSELCAYPDRLDENYIKTQPGLFPDPLYPMEDDEIEVVGTSCHSLWITVNLDGKVDAGLYQIEITFHNENYSTTKIMKIEIIDALLPEQKLIFTQWLHADCIASYYNTKTFSKKHWNLIDKFIKMAVDNGINMILTPVFTPPLDTKIGGERPTIQLVDVYKNGDKYSFDFTKLLKWIEICKRNGVKYYEMSHLFTQWGVEFTPKIVAVENGKKKKIFGWHVKSTSEKYKDFLNQFLPCLIDVLKNEKIADATYFHISDEPHEEHRVLYSKAKDMIREHLKEFKIIDALSNFEFYTQGLVDHPIPSSNRIGDFLKNNAKDLWTYYCCSQSIGVSNRFMAMPSYRNRIIATQLYKFNIKGFLHWGYNFYYSQYSKYKINPFLCTDSLNAFPSGDAFSVYPYSNGPIESLRIVVFHEALQDLRAMELLESYIGKDEVLQLIEKEAGKPIEFDQYPNNSHYILRLRELINTRISEIIRNKSTV